MATLRTALAVFLILTAPPVWAATVHSLNQVPGQLKSPEAKSYWRQEIVGKPAPDGLGVHLPPGLTASQIAAVLLPAGDRSIPTLVGAKPWPAGGKDRYVAILCLGGEKFDPSDPVCHRASDGPPLEIHLGVIAVPPGGTPRLVARLGPLRDKVDWDSTDMPAPDDVEAGEAIAPQSFDRFDLAPYRIAPDEMAFGLRVGWQYGYSGGGARYTALLLFATQSGALREVLAAPMSTYRDTAGDWHADGTRDHDITDEANILVISRHPTARHFDLVAKARNWDPVARAWMSIIGVGVEYGTTKDGLAVHRVVVGSPAAKAGLEAGDLIVAIDGHPTPGLADQSIKERMRGTFGSTVALTVRRKGRPPFIVAATRDLITLAPSPHLDYRWSAADGAYRAAACTKPCM